MIEFRAEAMIPDGGDIAITYNRRTVHFKEHVHDFVEFVYIESGSCLHYVNGVSYRAEKGDLIYIGVGETHAFQSDEDRLAYSSISSLAISLVAALALDFALNHSAPPILDSFTAPVSEPAPIYLDT